MVKYGLFDDSEEEILRKSVVFYSAIGAERPPEKFYLDNVGNVSAMQIKRDLNPVLRRGEKFNLEEVQKGVRGYLESVLVPTQEEVQFWRAFADREYLPELVFGKGQEFVNVEKHPMAIWKCRNK